MIKQQIKSPEQLEALKAEAASFEKKAEIKALADQVTWGPPVYSDRAVSINVWLLSGVQFANSFLSLPAYIERLRFW